MYGGVGSRAGRGVDLCLGGVIQRWPAELLEPFVDQRLVEIVGLALLNDERVLGAVAQAGAEPVAERVLH